MSVPFITFLVLVLAIIGFGMTRYARRESNVPILLILLGAMIWIAESSRYEQPSAPLPELPQLPIQPEPFNQQPTMVVGPSDHLVWDQSEPQLISGWELQVFPIDHNSSYHPNQQPLRIIKVIEPQVEGNYLFGSMDSGPYLVMVRAFKDEDIVSPWTKNPVMWYAD